MKKSLLKLSFLILIVASAIVTISISSCKIGSASLQVLQPADIMLPQHFQKFVLADRTRPGKGNGQQALNALEGLLTGEGIFQDKWGAEDCLEGLRQVLIQTPRYTVAIAALDTAIKGTGRRQTMPPLDWNTVSKLIGNDTETALVVLEAFDSNNDLQHEIVQTTQRGANGENINVPEYRAHNRVNVYCVWRIYDLKAKTIVDQYTQESYQQFDGSGATQAVADSRLPARRDMTSKAGISAGMQYGHRISPQWITVTRQYYKKGSDVLKSTAKLVKYNNWKAAADAWDKESTSADPKAAMRASFNMALASEKAGQLDLAIQWAERAQQLGDKRAARYIQILQQRQYDQKKLEEQMKGQKQ
ncbi:MAG: DUF6340 family protein [Bacteroidetes bacterium]|nr:DUF6340 family protein [Bacteroidota bacterium]